MKTWSYVVRDWPGLARRCHFSAREMATHCGIGQRQLERHFRDVHQMRLHCWINEVRLGDAPHLLLAGLQVKTVSYYLAFKSSTQFTAAFKKKHGLAPREYVQMHALDLANPQVPKEYENIFGK